MTETEIAVPAATKYAEAVLAAMSRKFGVLELDMDGTMVAANEIYLNTLGYRLKDIKGRHHSLLFDEAYRNSAQYREFWAKLRRGEAFTAESKRNGKDGREIWISADYNPILDKSGRPYKIHAFVRIITEEKLRNADLAGQIEAITKSQAVVEFQMDGTIVNANDNFLKMMEYSLDEVKGRQAQYCSVERWPAG